MKNALKKLFIIAMVFCVFISTNTVNTYALSQTSVTLKEGEYLGYLKDVDASYNHPLYVYNGVEEQIAYCYDVHSSWPASNSDFTNPYLKDFFTYEKKNYTLNDSENIMKVVYSGYPYNVSNIQGDLSDMQFRAVTQAAIWKFTDDIPLDTGYTPAIKKLINSNFKWTDEMTKAYNKLINTSSLPTPDENFELELYSVAKPNEYYPVQRLLSTKIKSNETPISLPVSTSIKVFKFLDNEPTHDINFKFQLVDSSENAVQTTETSNYEVIFDSITYISEGTYTYTVKEVDNNKENIKYDDREFKVEVVVTKGDNNNLKAVVQYYNENDELVDNITFENSTIVEKLPETTNPDNNNDNTVVDPDDNNKEDVDDNTVVDPDDNNKEDVDDNTVVDPDDNNKEDVDDNTVVDPDDNNKEDVDDNTVVDPDDNDKEDVDDNTVVDPDDNNKDDVDDNTVVEPDNNDSYDDNKDDIDVIEPEDNISSDDTNQDDNTIVDNENNVNANDPIQEDNTVVDKEDEVDSEDINQDNNTVIEPEYEVDSDNTSSPQTGDSSSVFEYATVLLFSICLLGFLLKKKEII